MIGRERRTRGGIELDDPDGVLVIEHGRFKIAVGEEGDLALIVVQLLLVR
jgi:hypothetical protein